MNKNKEYNIYFKKLEIGKHIFNFHIKEKFFKFFTFDEEFENPNLFIKIELEKEINYLKLTFFQKGSVLLTCDYSLDKFEYYLNNKEYLLIKFNKFFINKNNNINENILILSYHDYKIDISKYIYENFMLSLPKRRIHPDVKNNKSKSEVIKILNKYLI